MPGEGKGRAAARPAAVRTMPVTLELPLLIIKTGEAVRPLRDEGEDFEDLLIAATGLEPDRCVVRSLHRGEALPAAEGVGAVIVTGSPAYVTDEEPWNFVGADFLRAAHGLEIPVLGVCYGHQLLAWTFGGEVDWHPKGREIGTTEIRLTAAGREDPLLGGLPETFPAQSSHLQTVTRLPPGARLLAVGDFEPRHAFRLGGSTWGVQFHPEFTPRVMRAYIEDRREALASEGLDADALLAGVRETPDSLGLLRRFAAAAPGLRPQSPAAAS